MKPRCKHKWVDMEDGSLDQFCVRCSLKQMQSVMPLPFLNAEKGMEIGALMAEGFALGLQNAKPLSDSEKQSVMKVASKIAEADIHKTANAMFRLPKVGD